MPQRKQITWAQLRVGAMVIISLIILAVGIFFISGQVGFFTRRYALKTFLPSAGDIRAGAQVRLAGIAVGNVDRITISPYQDPNRAVEIDMSVSKSFQSQIRANSTATLETVGLLGETYVDITRGEPGYAVLQDGGTVQGRVEPDIKQIVQNTNDVISNLRVLTSKINDITASIQSGKGTIGKFINDPTLYNRMNDTVTEAQGLITNLKSGQGTLGKLLTDQTLYQQAENTITHLNQVVSQIQTGNGSMAKFINDPTLYNNLKDVSSRANALMDNINSGKGTLGKLATDPQLYNRVNDTMQKVDVIATRIDQGQGTLGKLSTDPSMFNNLNDASKSFRDFMIVFRKHPKKYLTLHLHIF
jgi:phospholipid/cholesterol/gamma-HCH transport system substrate-binding protein